MSMISAWMDDEYLMKCVVDPTKKTFYLFSNEGDEKEVVCDNIQCFTSNETGWTAVKGSVSGSDLTIQAKTASCTDTISWMVVGEREDIPDIVLEYQDGTKNPNLYRGS